MFVISEIMVDERIAETNFSCDLQQCKGACCTMPGGRGAPLEDHEVAEVERSMPFATEYLSARHREAIERIGSVEGFEGSYATVCIDDRACVFVYYEGDVARCSLERAYFEGKSKFRKPISCHLFPIRVSRDNAPVLRYEEIPHCRPAKERGNAEGVPLPLFLRDALTRSFGARWYNKFLEACREIRRTRPHMTTIPEASEAQDPC